MQAQDGKGEFGGGQSSATRWEMVREEVMNNEINKEIMGISPVHPKIHCQGLAGHCLVLCCRRSKEEEKKSSCKISGRKDLPAPRGGKDQKDSAEAAKKKKQKNPQNPTKVLKPQSSEVLTRDPG